MNMSTTTTVTKIKKQSTNKKDRPGDIRKEAKRLESSRDNQKKKSKSKSVTIKRLNGALDDTSNSRDAWREKSKEKDREVKRLNTKIEQYADKEIRNDEVIASLLDEIKKNSPNRA
jgi:septal ring factor EnvC (AmiA/AmiB activator)